MSPVSVFDVSPTGGVGAAGVGAPQLPAPGELGRHEPPVQSHEPQQSAVELHVFHAVTHAPVV